MEKQERTKCRECPKEFPVDPRVRQHHTCSEEECQKKRKKKNQAAYRARDPESVQNDRDCNKRLRERDPNYYRKWREAHPEYVERNREKQRERNRRRRAAQRQKEGRQEEKKDEVPMESLQDRMEPIAKSKVIAKVTEIPAYLVVNESFREAFGRKGEKVAKVTVIFADPKESQIDRFVPG